jgi:hypothetical protein
MWSLIALLSIGGVLAASPQQQVQVPLWNHQAQRETELRAWSFNFTSQAPHIFSSVHGLLQQWPNTYFPNGHTIVPCQIAAYTNLYHGRQDGELPPSPEWFAFDMEMAYGIMGSDRNSHLLTYQTTKQVGCLYFDGESATLMGSGQMDALMLFIYGNVTGPEKGGRWRGLADEYDRASKICDWVENRGVGGRGWGVEGIVRMNAGFEMIWCNFTSPSIRLLTRVNVTAPLLPEEKIEDDGDVNGYEGDAVPPSRKSRGSRTGPETDAQGIPTSYYPLPTETSPPDRSHDPDRPPMPPSWRREDREPFLASQTWGWFESATWHYGSSAMGAGRGEARVKLITCGVLSFYDPYFIQQQLSRAGLERERLNLTVDGLWRGPREEDDRRGALDQLMRRRRYHVLHNISQSDADRMNHAAETVLKTLGYDDPTGLKLHATSACTGVDWVAVTGDIVQRYAPRLQQINSILESGINIDLRNYTALRQWFVRLRQHTHFLLVPYFEYPDKAAEDEWSASSTTGQITWSRCKYHYTRLLASDQDIDLTPEESLLTWAVEEMLGNICSFVVEVGFAVEREWMHQFKPVSGSKAEEPPTEMSLEIRRWKDGVEELMAWLGWLDQWSWCREGCRWDEVCEYLLISICSARHKLISFMHMLIFVS